MLNETAEQKEQRIFEFYKNDLIQLYEISRDVGGLRFNCIEYSCRFPKIDPYKMAAALADYGVKILFDDSAISKAENKRKESQVYKLLSQYKKQPLNG